MRATGARRTRRSREEIEEILQAYGRSHLTQAKFAESQDVALSTLTSWLRRKRAAGSAGSANPDFVEAAVLESGRLCSGEEGAHFELILGAEVSGRRTVESLRISQGFESGDLKRVLGMLGVGDLSKEPTAE